MLKHLRPNYTLHHHHKKDNLETARFLANYTPSPQQKEYIRSAELTNKTIPDICRAPIAEAEDLQGIVAHQALWHCMLHGTGVSGDCCC